VIPKERKADLETVLNEIGIDPKRRGETLTVEEFGKLSDALLHLVK
jgi:16S rRNA (adenine1518-N6/adenine1519-N6)-dimethyltransferase